MSNKIRSYLRIFLTIFGIKALTICFVILVTITKLSKNVIDKKNYRLDESFLLWIYQWSNPKLDKIMLMITHLGDFNVVIIVITITLSILLQKSYYQEAKFFMIACFGHPILADGMKLLHGKPRPKLWTHLVEAGSFSFPSGHAVGAVLKIKKLPVNSAC
ncbi:phosphatase PAP2 family protein [Crocosphaera chwakensis]|uniref:Phosphatidic acid phosphatase type 2/haloperoxidase domain-containing protein n=1 Tax=Crocosphaera chwakensis CCY0110 TaxID=391612 RepID=A3IYJ9_9CHRO|nr:hypothetical protein [Crocosphaera chwakensis]EAZ88448.1 hypothetical protein CY0110_31175 [Crocosphaera chwakensis CCY0110]